MAETLSAGDGYRCGVEANGTLACRGLDNQRQVSPLAGAFVQVSAGSNHTAACGATAPGPAGCWNEYGQLGYRVYLPLVRKN